MADIIDLTLISESRRFLSKLLDTRGINYFLKQDASRPFRISDDKVNLVVRTAAKVRDDGKKPHVKAVDHARKEVRRLLIRRVVAEMLQTGL